jgi:hypothetical protein
MEKEIIPEADAQDGCQQTGSKSAEPGGGHDGGDEEKQNTGLEVACEGEGQRGGDDDDGEGRTIAQ